MEVRPDGEERREDPPAPAVPGEVKQHGESQEREQVWPRHPVHGTENRDEHSGHEGEEGLDPGPQHERNQQSVGEAQDQAAQHFDTRQPAQSVGQGERHLV